ncbi:MAG: putative 2OG-Fe(II) oxygenase [Caulobacteraceae bacterium]
MTAQLAYDLLGKGRAQEALAAIEPFGRLPSAPHADLAAYATTLKALGRLEEALAVSRQAVDRFPVSAVAEHNLASVLGDLGMNVEAEAACRRAFKKGGDSAQTWAVLGAALVGEGKADEAIAAFEEAIRRDPEFVVPYRNLAQVIWMMTGDVQASAARLRAAVDRYPQNPFFAIQLAKALEFGGRGEEALAVLQKAASRLPRPEYELERTAAGVASTLGRSSEALAHATRALQERPGDQLAGVLACDALLGLGQPEQVAQLATRLHQAAPNEQQILSRLGTALRMLGDDLYPVLYDYQTLVRPSLLDTPAGWPSLEAYLADLASALKALHAFQTHPFDQSLRHGSQTAADLKRSDDPAIKAFFHAIDRPIRDYMVAAGVGRDPLRRRNTGAYAIAGIWSVMLRPNGFHVDHVHPEGWLSSACYIELPGAVEAGGREGWIKFGEPGVPTTPKLEPEHFVKPEPGMLVLFPSYMWHGTVPFSGDQPRLTVAFDVIPA